MALRTGDTPRGSAPPCCQDPPDILITTPESLYLMVTAERSRGMLAAARTVIVDEIHAVAGNKRGSHLALTVERLAHVAAGRVQRIGLSATVSPIETIARLLVGWGPGASGRTARRAARSWTPATGGTWTWPSTCPTTSLARSPPASRWRRSST